MHRPPAPHPPYPAQLTVINHPAVARRARRAGRRTRGPRRSRRGGAGTTAGGRSSRARAPRHPRPGCRARARRTPWSRAAASAQRCSNEWKPPGVICGPGGPFGPPAPFIHAAYARPSKLGIVGSSRRHAADRPQSRPVPRGPKSHLWVPATKKSQPRSSKSTSSAPNAWTPSTHSRTRSFSSRRSFTVASADASRLIGSFSPVLE